MFDVITFGSATRDAFFYSKAFKIFENQKVISGKAFCFNLGSKIEIDKIVFTTGGGGTNTACSFSKFGFKTACVAQVGNDVSGRAVQEDLKKDKVDTKFIIVNNKFNTAYSVILSIPGRERTILVYRGASEHISFKKIDIKNLRTKWFYLSSLGGEFTLLKNIFNYAEKNKIKIAINPGTKELARRDSLFPLIKKADIIFLNQEEAAKLTGLSFNRPQEILKKLNEEIKGIFVMTCGRAGSMAMSEGKIYQAGILPGKVLERTGAGDAFNSGFLSGIMKKNNVIYALQLGTANATSVIKKIGAKNGLLSKKDLGKFKKVKVKILND